METAGWIMWFVGFVMAVAFLNLALNINQEAFWYAFGAECGGVIFTLGIFNRH